MSPFQWIAVPILALVALRDIASFFRHATARRFTALRILVWTAAALAIAFPDIPQHLALLVGITRGADLVFYLFVLAFLVGSLMVYGKLIHLQKQITDLVRILAVQQARTPRE